jgi:hypothetical protein
MLLSKSEKEVNTEAKIINKKNKKMLDKLKVICYNVFTR